MKGFILIDGARSGKIAAVVIWLMLCFPFARAQNFSDIKPSPQQVEWQDLEFGVLTMASACGRQNKPITA